MAVSNCASCGGPRDAMQVESSHYTSEGIVRYLLCPCGERRVETARFGAVVGVDGTPWSTAN
ncbi:hypothetical protein ACFOVU_07195 [Nocardiopsis sediminis]|uniref:Uncharacterized protein n=1 Tax=Nocardiopsis sediminis TaxID=1778267 RepID=A0ABV8FK09_9ACTN